VAEDLHLAVPTACWHTTRNRVAELAAAGAVTGGALATVALSVTLLAQGHLEEVTEGVPGGSSAMPHKRNPARAVHVIAATHRMPGLVATVLAGMPQELQRATGRWQAEWQTVADLLRLLAAAAAHSRVLVTELHVNTARMTTNLLAAGVPGATVPIPPALRDGADRMVDRALAAHREPACSTST
jgi:3-carboxy-cis,cis-muconate cycloisomerase